MENSNCNLFRRFGKAFDDEISFARSFNFMPEENLQFPDTFRTQGTYI